jgi:hypothetical protein
MLPTQTINLFFVRGDTVMVERQRSSSDGVMSSSRRSPKAGRKWYLRPER